MKLQRDINIITMRYNIIRIILIKSLLVLKIIIWFHDDGYIFLRLLFKFLCLIIFFIISNWK